MKSALFGLFVFGGWFVIAGLSSTFACALLSPWRDTLQHYPVPATLLVAALSCVFPLLWTAAVMAWARR